MRSQVSSPVFELAALEPALEIFKLVGIHRLVEWMNEVSTLRSDREHRIRGVQNRDLHRLIGEAIATVLERNASSIGGGPDGVKYLKKAAAAFRSDRWMDVELTGTQVEISEPAIATYFTGDAEAIKSTPVLDESEWLTLIRNVAGDPTNENVYAADQAARVLCSHFAGTLWETAKLAWKHHDVAWPALNIRLLSLILDRSIEASKRDASLGSAVKQLEADLLPRIDAISRLVAGRAATMSAAELAEQADSLRAIAEMQGHLEVTLARAVDGQAAILERLADMGALQSAGTERLSSEFNAGTAAILERQDALRRVVEEGLAKGNRGTPAKETNALATSDAWSTKFLEQTKRDLVAWRKASFARGYAPVYVNPDHILLAPGEQENSSPERADSSDIRSRRRSRNTTSCSSSAIRARAKRRRFERFPTDIARSSARRPTRFRSTCPSCRRQTTMARQSRGSNGCSRRHSVDCGRDGTSTDKASGNSLVSGHSYSCSMA